MYTDKLSMTESIQNEPIYSLTNEIDELYDKPNSSVIILSEFAITSGQQVYRNQSGARDHQKH